MQKNPEMIRVLVELGSEVNDGAYCKPVYVESFTVSRTSLGIGAKAIPRLYEAEMQRCLGVAVSKVNAAYEQIKLENKNGNTQKES